MAAPKGDDYPASQGIGILRLWHRPAKIGSRCAREKRDWRRRRRTLAYPGAVVRIVSLSTPRRLRNRRKRPRSSLLQSRPTTYPDPLPKAAAAAGHRRAGHVFQGRFKARLVEDDIYLCAVTRYIHLNQVKIAAYSRMARGQRWLDWRAIAGGSVAAASSERRPEDNLPSCNPPTRRIRRRPPRNYLTGDIRKVQWRPDNPS